MYSTGQKSPLLPSNLTKSINEMRTFLFYKNSQYTLIIDAIEIHHDFQ